MGTIDYLGMIIRHKLYDDNTYNDEKKISNFCDELDIADTFGEPDKYLKYVLDLIHYVDVANNHKGKQKRKYIESYFNSMNQYNDIRMSF